MFYHNLKRTLPIKKLSSPRYAIKDVLLFHKSNISQIEDDGYSRSQGLWGWTKRLYSKLQGPKQPGILILVRHGESVWNHNKTFTGWVDADLGDRGRREIEHAARLLLLV
jgi:hypothetical protein